MPVWNEFFSTLVLLSTLSFLLQLWDHLLWPNLKRYCSLKHRFTFSSPTTCTWVKDVGNRVAKGPLNAPLPLSFLLRIISPCFSFFCSLWGANLCPSKITLLASAAMGCSMYIIHYGSLEDQMDRKELCLSVMSNRAGPFRVMISLSSVSSLNMIMLLGNSFLLWRNEDDKGKDKR